MRVSGWTSERRALPAARARRRSRLAARVAALLLTVFSACAVAQDYAVVVMYHRVGDGRYPSTNIRLEQFRAHLHYLSSHGFHVLPLARILRRLRENRPLPANSIAITFDDAYHSVLDNAASLLSARGWPYTVFVSTGYIDKGYDGFLSWEEMRRMAGQGATFADHSSTHGHLIRRRDGETRDAWRDRVRRDIVHAQQRLEAELGDAALSSPPLLAYPYGEYDTALAGLVERLGYVGMGQQSGVVGAGSDRRALPRFAFNEHYGEMKGFIDKVTGRPLPVSDVTPWTPVTDDSRPPVLSFRVGSTRTRLDRLTCYFQGTRTQVSNPKGRRLRVAAPEASLPRGRSHYDCTLPVGDGTWYWYTHLWIRR